MRANSAQADLRPRNGVAASASIAALVAIAVTVCMAQGANVAGLPDVIPGAKVGVREASARVVAAAVTAAVRDMVGHDTIDSAAHFECAAPLACLCLAAVSTADRADAHRSHAPPIAPQLLNIPPPTI